MGAMSGPATPAAPSPSTHPPGKRPTTVIIAVVVAVVAFVAGLGVESAIHPSSSAAASPGSSALTYAQAKALADGIVRGEAGSWEENASVGIDATTGVFYPASGSGECPFPGFWIPRFSGLPTSGEAPFWFFVYLEDTGAVSPGELVVIVENGSATITVEEPVGTICTTSYQGASAITGAVANSPAVAVNASSRGGSAFLLGQPSSSVLFEIGAGGSWSVYYDPCGVVAGRTTLTGVQPTLTVTLSASSGAFEGSETGTTACVSSTPYTVSLTQGASGVLSSAADFDNLSVATVTAALPLQYVAAYVETAHDAEVYPTDSGCFQPAVAECPEPAYGWYLTVSAGETIQATYFGSPPVNGWAEIPGYTTNDLQAGETITIVSNGALAGSGDTFALLGTSGSVISGSITL